MKNIIEKNIKKNNIRIILKKSTFIFMLATFLFSVSCESLDMFVRKGHNGENLYELELYGENIASSANINIVDLHGFNIQDFNDANVARYIKYYQTSARNWMQVMLDRAEPYKDYIRQVFLEEGVPLDLMYLPMIESSFDPHAVSRVGAAGLWQFMPRTGEIYGLKINYWVDDRFDPERSTRAAAKHLKMLNKNFKNWVLSLIAYNAGGGRVSRAIKKAGSNNFWELARMEALPEETRNYIPKFVAAVIIAKNPETFGFTVKKPNVIFPQGDIVYIDDAADISIIADAIDVPAEDIKILNPQLAQGVTPPSSVRYPLRVPQGKGEIFESTFGSIPKEERITFRRHIVRMNETISHLARFYNVPQFAILDLNKMGSRSTLQIGQNILIPIRGLDNAKQVDMLQYETEQQRIAEGKFVEFANLPPPDYDYKDIIYCILPGDSLWNIAVKFKIDIDQIKAWNKMKSNTLSIGDEIFLRIPQ